MVDGRACGELLYRLRIGEITPALSDGVFNLPLFPFEVPVMKSILRIGLLCAAVMAASSAPILAQGRGGGRGFGGATRAQLATLKEVQAELKMTDDQKKVATEAVEKMTAARRELFSAGPGGDPNEMREKMAKLTAEADSTLAAKLDDAQKKRLMEVYVQKAGTAALADAEVQKALGLKEEEIKKLAEARAANQEAMMAAFQELGQDAAPEVRQEKMTAVRKAADEKLFSAISADQKAAFEKLGGAKLEVDLSPLQPRRGGGPGGPGGGRPPQ
jgi:hypothetical protein